MKEEKNHKQESNFVLARLIFAAAIALAVAAIIFAIIAIVQIQRAKQTSAHIEGRTSFARGTLAPDDKAPAEIPRFSEEEKIAQPSGPTRKANARAAADQNRTPSLVPGNPLTDDRFAQLSAEVVIAAIGLQRDKDWETHLLLYMEKTLQKHGLTVEQYTEYAQALYAQPDRARAVAENIMQRVEKRLGYRVSLKALPFHRFDEREIKALAERLQR